VERLGVLLLFLSLSFSALADPPAECDGSIKCIKLTWEAPTEREDGTAIAQIDRYDIHHTANNVFQGIIQVQAPSVEHYLVDVAAGNHTLTIRAVEGDVLGIMSSPATATILQAQIGPMTLTIQVL
jgi:hypothetical protein